MATSESDQSPGPETNKDVESAEPSQPTESGSTSADEPVESQKTTMEFHQHHVSKILDEVLDEPAEAQTPGRIKHPMILDLVLAVSLLVAMGGFTIGLMKMYLTHSAEQLITQHNYKAAIAIIKGAPLPGFFTIPGSDSEELLNQALYLDAMDKMDSNTEKDTTDALNELQQITPGSRYFALAQEVINENFEPSSTILKMGVETVEHSPTKTGEEKKPFSPDYPKDATP